MDGIRTGIRPGAWIAQNAADVMGKSENLSQRGFAVSQPVELPGTIRHPYPRTRRCAVGTLYVKIGIRLEYGQILSDLTDPHY